VSAKPADPGALNGPAAGVPVPGPRGDGRLVRGAGGPDTVLLLHAAGSGVDHPALVAVGQVAAAAGWRVATLEQAYRVAGRRIPDPAPALDATALAACELLAEAGGALVLVGRSSGARVACRVAAGARADAVVALGFPLHVPGAAAARPSGDRSAELLLPPCEVLVVQGDRDRFGMPRSGDRVRVVAVPGADHGFAVQRPGAPDADARRQAVLAAVAALAGEELARVRAARGKRRGGPDVVDTRSGAHRGPVG
jgi:uncharacterized protein